MSEYPRGTDGLIDEARRGHDPSPEQRERVLEALHARLDFRGEPSKQRHMAAAAAAAAVAADAVLASTGKAASALTGKVVLKLFFATVALGGGVTTAVMVHQQEAPRAARVAVVEQRAGAPRPLTQAAPASEPKPVVDALAVSEPLAPIVEAPAPARERDERRGRSARRPSEIALIGRALASLRDRDPQRTLVLLDEHATLYPQGKFATERNGLRVLALCASGRIEEGRRARAAFLRDSARAPIAARVREACVDAPGSSAREPRGEEP